MNRRESKRIAPSFSCGTFSVMGGSWGVIGFDAVGKRGTKPVRSQHFFDMNRQRPAVKRIKRVYRRPTDGGTDRLSFCVGCGSGSQRRHVTLGRSARDSDARFRSGRPAQALGLSCLTDGSWNINNNSVDCSYCHLVLLPAC